MIINNFEQLHTQEFGATKMQIVRLQLNEKKWKENESWLMSLYWKRKPTWKKDLVIIWREKVCLKLDVQGQGGELILDLDGQGGGGGSWKLNNFHGRHMCIIPNIKSVNVKSTVELSKKFKHVIVNRFYLNDTQNARINEPVLMKAFTALSTPRHFVSLILIDGEWKINHQLILGKAIILTVESALRVNFLSTPLQCCWPPLPWKVPGSTPVLPTNYEPLSTYLIMSCFYRIIQYFFLFEMLL